jgi:MraZ protein
MDSVGRFVLPQLLREAANLSGEVAVLGKTNYLEIFNMGTITQSIKERTMSAEARAKIAMLLVQPV